MEGPPAVGARSRPASPGLDRLVRHEWFSVFSPDCDGRCSVRAWDHRGELTSMSLTLALSLFVHPNPDLCLSACAVLVTGWFGLFAVSICCADRRAEETAGADREKRAAQWAALMKSVGGA